MKKREVIAAICALFILALAVFLFTQRPWEGQGTRLSFTGTESGFRHEASLYTEGGLTGIHLTGQITVDGVAEVSLVAEKDGSLIYSKTFTDSNGESVTIEVDGLSPYSHYKLRFIGAEAKSGALFLTTEQSLAQRPESPVRPERNK